MEKEYKKFRDSASSALLALSKEFDQYADATMLVGAAETNVTLYKHNIYKSIDTDWIDAIEAALPSLDIIIRNPRVMIEDVDEILPIELSRHITEKSIKHLAQNTNLILDVRGDEVIPQKILNVYHDETYLTYENKFINTLLARLSAFVDRRYRALTDSNGTERNYKFDYKTEFEHLLSDDGGRNSARIHLSIELTSPLDAKGSESDVEINDRYVLALSRIKRINSALVSYHSSPFIRAMGRNFIRPPVIRTNAILKNKNFKDCLTLWEFIESFDKVGYNFNCGEDVEMPSSEYISDLYSSVALQYLNFYNGVAERDDNRLLSHKQLFEVAPEFDLDTKDLSEDEYKVYDTEYRKLVPVSRLMNNRKKLSEDEDKISRAILVALKADEMLNEQYIEEEKRRLEEREAKRKAELARREEEARLREKRRLEEEAARAAEAERISRELAKMEEERRLAAEQKEAEERERQENERLLAIAREEAKKLREERAKIRAEVKRRREQMERLKNFVGEEDERLAAAKKRLLDAERMLDSREKLVQKGAEASADDGAGLITDRPSTQTEPSENTEEQKPKPRPRKPRAQRKPPAQDIPEPVIPEIHFPSIDLTMDRVSLTKLRNNTSIEEAIRALDETKLARAGRKSTGEKTEKPKAKTKK